MKVILTRFELPLHISVITDMAARGHRYCPASLRSPVPFLSHLLGLPDQPHLHLACNQRGYFSHRHQQPLSGCCAYAKWSSIVCTWLPHLPSLRNKTCFDLFLLPHLDAHHKPWMSSFFIIKVPFHHTARRYLCSCCTDRGVTLEKIKHCFIFSPRIKLTSLLYLPYNKVLNILFYFNVILQWCKKMALIEQCHTLCNTVNFYSYRLCGSKLKKCIFNTDTLPQCEFRLCASLL